jgi:hypothetical protein
VEAEICGILAGGGAASASYFGFMWLAPKLSGYGINVDEILEILQSSKLVLMFLVFVGLGIIIGRVSARLAVSKYLHKA